MVLQRAKACRRALQQWSYALGGALLLACQTGLGAEPAPVEAGGTAGAWSPPTREHVTPQDVGRMPDLEHTELALPGSALSPGRAGELIAVGTSREKDGASTWTATGLTHGLEVRYRVERPQPWEPNDRHAPSALLPDGEGGAFVVWHGRTSWLYRLDAEGETQLELEVPGEVLTAQRVVGQAWADAIGVALVLGIDARNDPEVLGQLVSLRDADGVEVERLRLPGERTTPYLAGMRYLRAFAVDRQGRFLYSISGTGTLVQCARSADNPHELEVRWEADLTAITGFEADDIGLGRVHVGDDGALTLAGTVYGRFEHVTFSQPFVARLDADGELRWLWHPLGGREGVAPGDLLGVEVDREGHVYLAGHERSVWLEPESEEDRAEECWGSLGCDGIVVRKLSPEGELLWQYQRRSQVSRIWGHHPLAIDTSGALWVMGRTHPLTEPLDQPQTFRPNPQQPLILRFDP